MKPLTEETFLDAIYKQIDNLASNYVTHDLKMEAAKAVYEMHRKEMEEMMKGFAEWCDANHWWRSTDTRFPSTLTLWTQKINGDFKREEGKTTHQLLGDYLQSPTHNFKEGDIINCECDEETMTAKIVK